MLKSLRAQSYSRQTGLSLIELMVAITLSALLLLGITQSYSDNIQSNAMQQAYARIQESGRFAMEMMSHDIRMADYWGCLSNNTTSDIHNNLDTSASNYATDAAPLVNSFQQSGLSGQDNVPAGTTVAGMSVVAGTDVLTLTGAGGSSSIQVVPPYMNTSSAALHVSTGNSLKQGDILMVTDCSGGDVFEVTNSNPSTSGTVDHNTGTVTVVGNGTKNLSRVYGGDTEIMTLTSKTYFIATGTNGRPSLYLSTNGVPVEMVPNVENMEITYGEDTNGDKVVDVYHDASAVTNMEAVLSVRVKLIISSANSGFGVTGSSMTVNGSTIAADGRLRKVFVSVSNIRNRMDG